MQYTIRQIPKQVDQALRARAKREKKSLNQLAVEALSNSVGVDGGRSKKRDLSDLFGKMTAEDARAIEESVAWMDKVDVEFQGRGGK